VATIEKLADDVSDFTDGPSLTFVVEIDADDLGSIQG
jgi:hypothetical protein